MTVPVLLDLEARLGKAAAEVADARLQLELTLARRNDIAVEAVDGGMEQAAVARVLGVSGPHMCKILALSQPDAVLPR